MVFLGKSSKIQVYLRGGEQRVKEQCLTMSGLIMSAANQRQQCQICEGGRPTAARRKKILDKLVGMTL